jgi:hypothetical protein
VKFFNIYRVGYRLPGAKAWEHGDEDIAALSVQEALNKFIEEHGSMYIVTSIYTVGDVKV